MFGISRLFFGAYLGAPRVLLVCDSDGLVGFEVSSVAAGTAVKLLFPYNPASFLSNEVTPLIPGTLI